MEKHLNESQTCLYCGLTGVHPKGRFCPAYGKRCYSCRKFNHFAFVCMSSRIKYANRRNIKYHKQERHNGTWIKHLIKVAEVEEDSDEYSDEEFEGRLAEHMRISNYPERINYGVNLQGLHEQNTQENSHVKWMENNFPGRPGNDKEEKKQNKGVVEYEHIKGIQQELEDIKSELAASKADSSLLRKNFSTLEAEWNKCQVRINEYCIIIQLQKKEVDKLKKKTENCEPLKSDSSKYNCSTTTLGSERYDFNMKAENLHAEMASSSDRGNCKLEDTYNVKLRRNKIKLPLEDTHIAGSTAWLKDEAENFQMICQDFHAWLKRIMGTLGNEQKLTLGENEFK